MPSIHKPLTFLLLLAVGASLATPVDSNAPKEIICKSPASASIPICNQKRDPLILGNVAGALEGDDTTCQQHKQEVSNLLAKLQALDDTAKGVQQIPSVACQTGCSAAGSQESGSGRAAPQGNVSGSP